MKNLKNTGIILFTIGGILLGLLIASISLLVNYCNGFNGYFHQLFQYSHDFYVMASLPFVLGFLFCYIGRKREQYFSLNQQVTTHLMEEKAQHSAARIKLERALQVAQIGSWEIDYVNNKQYISDQLRCIYNLPLTGLITAEQMYENMFPDDVSMLNKMTAEAASDLKQVEVEYRYLLNGEVNYMVSNISPIFNSQGQLISLFGTVKNITHIKRTELSLKKSEEEKSVVLDNTHALIFVHDMQGIIMDVNKSGQKMSGYEKEEMVGERIDMLLSKSYKAKFDDYLAAIQTKANSNGTLHIITKSGNKRVWLYENTLYHNNGNNPYIIASAVDITESVNAKNEIEKQQQIIREIIEGSPNVIFVIDEKQQIILANSTFSNFYNYNENETPLVSSLCKGEHDIFLWDAENISKMEDGEMEKSEGKLLHKNDGTEHWFNIIKKCFRKPSGEKYMLGFGMDITERYQIEKDLKTANEIVEHSSNVKKQFLANMSHEIRTPLNAVIGFTDLLSDTSLDSEQGEYIQIVKTASQNLLALINNILDMSKIESGNISLESLPVDIRQIVVDVKKILEQKAKTKALDIFTNFSNNIPAKVLGDQLRLTQIMFNLVGNAVKFTDEGFININCKMVNGNDPQKIYIAFSIQDTGIGIPEDKHKDIFDRFTQANLDTQRLYGGSGLGLSIVKSIVDMQQGSISVESTPGKGTIFHFILPFKKYKETEALPDMQTDKCGTKLFGNAARPLQVLLAEDNDVNAKLAIKVLTKKGFDVKRVSNGMLAVEAVQNNIFDVVLMDIQMPVMNGIASTQEIRKLPGIESQVPIIALTAHSLHGEIQNCYNAGINGYLAKPFKPDDLFSAISDALNNAVKKDGLLFSS